MATLLLATQLGACLTPLPPSEKASAPVSSAASPAPEKVATPVSSAASSSGLHSLTQEQIRSVVMSHLDGLKACYTTEAARRAVRGKLTVKWQIEATGAVGAVQALGSTLGSARMEQCILSEIGRWRFPASPSVSNVEWPFIFGPGEADGGS
jgi:outer membrane biosynthesis protein TonB